MKRNGQTQPEISPYIGVREAARLLGVGENRMGQSVTLPDGSLGCAAFPSLARIQDRPPAAGVRGSQILFVREQVVALSEQRRQPPRIHTEQTRSLAFSEEAIRELLAMGPAGVRTLRVKL